MLIVAILVANVLYYNLKKKKCERAQLSAVFCYVFSTEVQTNTSSCFYLLLSVTSKQSCNDLQKEKEETRTSLEEALKTLKEQHKEELVQLEDRCGIHCDVPVSCTRDNLQVMCPFLLSLA